MIKIMYDKNRQLSHLQDDHYTKHNNTIKIRPSNCTFPDILIQTDISKVIQI